MANSTRALAVPADSAFVRDRKVPAGPVRGRPGWQRTATTLPVATELHTSLNEVDPAEWDAIVPSRRLFQRHAYHKAIHEAGINDCEYRYFVARGVNGEMRAHASFYSMSTPLDLFLPRQSGLARLLGGLRTVYPRFLDFRLVECGSPTTLGHPIAFAPGLSGFEKTAIVAALVGHMENLAREKKADLLVLRDLRDEEGEELGRLLDTGFESVPNLEDTRLDISWKSFEQYLASLKSHYRRQVRLNLVKARQAGLEAERVTDFSPYAEDLVRLWNRTSERSKEYQREQLRTAYFRSLARNLNGEAFATLFRLDGRLVGFTLYLANDDELVPSYIGIDYERNAEAALVFNAYYDWIRTGIELGFRSIELGITTYEPKRRLGAGLERLNVLMRHRRPALTPMVAALYRAMTPRQKVMSRNVFKASGV